jgi:hypothetical protein
MPSVPRCVVFSSGSGDVSEPGDGGAEMGFRRVPELGDERMPFERLLHDAPLDALAAAVDHSNFAQARRVRGVDVRFDHRFDVPRREGVKIDGILDGHSHVGGGEPIDWRLAGPVLLNRPDTTPSRPS